MEWLNKKRTFTEGAIKLFGFHSDKQCAIRTITLRRGQPTSMQPYESIEHTSEEGYMNWLKSVDPSLEKQQQASLVLVMHTRLSDTHAATGAPLDALALPYKQDTFQVANERLFQHGSLALAVSRASTAVFNNRRVIWGETPTSGTSVASPSSLDSPNDIALSATSFAERGTTYAVMYGCTAGIVKLTSAWLRNFSDQALHPLIMPMIFAELERKRLFGMLDREQSSLKQRILDFENKLRGGNHSGTFKREAEKADVLAQPRDCESTKVWIDVSSLKNGIESLKAQLLDMIEHSEELADTVFRPTVKDAQASDDFCEERKTGGRIAARLREMVAEFDSKVRSCDSLLGGMALAAQMESNYYTRRDAKVAIIIANLTKKDGSQMKSIALLGMIFLPGTFLATLFSTSFFNWTAASSEEVISPWIALYGALTVAVTAITVWRMKKWMAREEKNAAEQIHKELSNDEDIV